MMLAVGVILRLGRWQTALLLVLAVILAVGMPGSSGAISPGALSLGDQSAELFSNRSNDWLLNYLLLLVLTAPLWLLVIAKHGNPFHQIKPGN
jgi:hypothetical protein